MHAQPHLAWQPDTRHARRQQLRIDAGAASGGAIVPQDDVQLGWLHACVPPQDKRLHWHAAH